jgi:hemin uptake protein HemP
MTILNNETTPRSVIQSEMNSARLVAQTNGKVNSEALLGRCNQLIIRHMGEHYILRQTRAGKLILTK